MTQKTQKTKKTQKPVKSREDVAAIQLVNNVLRGDLKKAQERIAELEKLAKAPDGAVAYGLRQELEKAKERIEELEHGRRPKWQTSDRVKWVLFDEHGGTRAYFGTVKGVEMVVAERVHVHVDGTHDEARIAMDADRLSDEIAGMFANGGDDLPAATPLVVPDAGRF